MNSKLLLFVIAGLIVSSYYANDIFAEEKNSVGQIQWLEASYPSTGTSVVRVIDPDMNFDPKAVDNFDVDVWSDTDLAGIDLTVTETNDNTGIFEGTVFFTITDESSGHRLRVGNGDTIHSKYEDNTVPGMNAKNNQDVIDTASIQGTSDSIIDDRVSLDKKSYSWADKIYVTIIAPEHNLDGDSIEKIDGSEQNRVEIVTRHFEIHDYQLIETGIDTGIFAGEITLSENEFYDINSVGDDGISVFFEYEEDITAIGSASIIWDSFEYSDSDGPSVSFDRDVYPVPFGGVNDFEDTVSSVPDSRSLFPVHMTALRGNSIDASTTLGTGDLTIYIRINDTNFDVSPQKVNEISQEIDGDIVGPLKISVLRDSQSIVLAYAGGSTPNENGLIDVGDNNLENVRELGSIYEIAPDSGIFELDFVIRYTDGPSNPKCPTTAVFTSLNDDAVYGSEESRFDLPSTEKENYCIMNGDVLTVEYTSLDESGNVNVVTDSATFELRNGILESNKPVYMIGSDMILTLTDPDFDLDSDVAETLTLDLIEWDSDAATVAMGQLGGEISAFDPEPSDFRETGDSTGIFQIVIEIPKELNSDHLERGEEIVLEYTDWGPSGARYVGHEDEDINVTIFTSNFGATVHLDQKVYTWTDKVYITIVAPDHNFDSDLIDEIGDNDEYPVKIATRNFALENYKLVETGYDTGIFTGEVILTGFTSQDADGNGFTEDASGAISDDNGGPTDGFIPSSNEDGVSISFEFSEDETVVGSALIQWNEGQIEWLEGSYPATGTGVVRVIDPDLNFNPEAVDNFDIDVWSDSDAGGISLTMTETNEATGIFEGTVFFSTTDESSGHRLRVSGSNTITAEYEDNTLPAPYTISDQWDITSTALIQKIPLLSPNKQLMMGIMTNDVTCKDKFEKIFRPSGFVACVDSSSVKKLMQRGWSLDIIPVDFTGEWKNNDSKTNDIANILITQTDSTATARIWDSCDPNAFCDWENHLVL